MNALFTLDELVEAATRAAGPARVVDIVIAPDARTVRVRLEGQHPRIEARARCRVVRALRTLVPPSCEVAPRLDGRA